MLLAALGAAPAGAQAIVAHRGASFDAPENTLAAFRLAWEQGADAIEGDFWLTADGQIVCIHDKTTKRTAGVDLAVPESKLAELRRLDVGSWKDAAFAGERIPTLAEVLATAPARGRIFIEIKCGPEIVPALRKVLARQRLAPAQTVVIAFDREVIAAVRQQIPRIDAHWLTSYRRDRESGEVSPGVDEVFRTLGEIEASGLDTKADRAVVDRAFVARLRGAGLELHCWTVDDPDDALHFRALGVDSITTNRPGWLREQLPSPDLDAHLAVHLRLDGDCADASGHGRDGELAGAGRDTARWTEGVFGRALDLSGGEVHVALGYRLPERGTVCLWYRTRPWYDDQTVFDGSAHADEWEMWVGADARLCFRARAGGTKYLHSFHPSGDLGEWHHLAVVWDRGATGVRAVWLYVDGVASEEFAVGRLGFAEPGETFQLGGGAQGNQNGTGTFDDLAIYDAPLEPRDIRFVMRRGAGMVP